MSLKTEMCKLSDLVNRLMTVGLLLIGLVWIGIGFLKWKWLNSVEAGLVIAVIFIYILLEVQFEAMKCAAAALDEMQEYVDKRFEELQEKNRELEIDL